MSSYGKVNQAKVKQGNHLLQLPIFVLIDAISYMDFNKDMAFTSFNFNTFSSHSLLIVGGMVNFIAEDPLMLELNFIILIDYSILINVFFVLKYKHTKKPWQVPQI